MKGTKAGTSASRRPRKSRGRGLRTTTGCITCRKRHIKCDEVKPVCQTCSRNKKTCIYPDSSQATSQTVSPPEDGSISTSNVLAEDPSDDFADLASESNGVALSAPQTHIYSSEIITRGVNETSDSTRENDSRRTQYLSPQNSMPTSEPQPTDPLLSELNDQRLNLRSPDSARDLSRHHTSQSGIQHGTLNLDYTSPTSIGTASDQPIGVATARWFGMLAGDADIPLDTNYTFTTYVGEDTLLSTEDLNTNGNQLTQNIQRNDNTAEPTSQPHHLAAIPGHRLQNLAEESLWQTSSPLTMKQEEERMFHKFVTQISQWMDIFDPHRHFCSLVPRLALHNIGLLNAILALSFRHDSLGSQSSFAREDALQYYHETLQYVRKAMQYTSYHTSLELLATTVIISAYEMLDGSSRDWERHLQGVFWIQRSQVIHGDSGGLRAAVWWAWLCQDTWAAFRDKRKVFTFWKPEKSLSEMEPLQLASRAVFILGRVTNYCALADAENSVANMMSKIEMAERLSAMLDEWESLLTPEFLPLPHNQQIIGSNFRPIWIHPPTYALAVQVHHASRILVLLHRPSVGGINEGFKRQSLLDKNTETICGIALMLSDYASATMASQCVFIGLCTHDRQRRTEILQILQRFRVKTGWPKVPLEEDLKRYWENSSSI